MELLSVIRRWHYRDHFSIREIFRRTGLSRNTVRKYLRSDSVEAKFAVPDRPSRLDPFADKLSRMLRQETGRPRKQKRTIKQLHADLVGLGYDGSYYKGPVSSTHALPRIKLDLTADEHVVLPAVPVEIFHPYSDMPEEGIEVLAYDYIEAFAEKFRALAERARPRDLYDVVNLYRNADARPERAQFVDVLREKCAFKKEVYRDSSNLNRTALTWRQDGSIC